MFPNVAALMCSMDAVIIQDVTRRVGILLGFSAVTGAARRGVDCGCGKKRTQIRETVLLRPNLAIDKGVATALGE